MRSASEFLDLVEKNFSETSDHFVWRGMMTPTWVLQSSLSRELAKMPLRGIEWKTQATIITIRHLRCYLEQLRGLSQLTREHGALYAALEREERQNYPSFIDVIQNLKQFERTILELFAMGQHHKMLTPFLDWTTTPAIALYFAFENLDPRPDGVGERVVYALNRTVIEEECPRTGSPKDDDVVFMDSMAYDNPRIIGQSGLFSWIPANAPLDRWVVGRQNFQRTSRAVLIRFLIPNRDRIQCLRQLELSGVDARKIYPDLEGAATNANTKVTSFIKGIRS